ncbi:lipoprotein N-acyltransferase Lnb domain-containing protein [Pseudoponticoccus marisrubri]|uniref:Lnb N-terminal periplasmic domain-containing protein n=1 Tax=Pseudoponticoccus marisrubri TaxID=1685382 RepID=A0A0W7WPU3_9RHOB|nr:DUF4105 domain-containing protein [Pseudoponticoccus marisrubri]KUF12545.1 hypothetical protein AVJ23_02115 [Pseudoponticoccus marisrubri]
MKKLFPIVLAALVVVVAGLWLNWQLATPSHDRNWRADHARLPQVSESDGIYRVENLRNWDYAPDGTPRAERWEDVAIDPDTLTQAYYLVEPFGDVDAIAHTMLSFAFEDGSAHVVSIEARREVGETYSAPKAAVLPIFEYMFLWTTERDMFGNSEFWAEDQLYLYPLDIPLEQQKAVLRAMLDETADLAAQPRWYNTLFSNCTNVLARTVNKLDPGAVPFDIAWILPGYSDEFLYEQGFIAQADSFETAEAQAHISPLIREFYALAEPRAFSTALREAMARR